MMGEIMIGILTILDKNFSDTESKNEVNEVSADEININLIDNIKNPEIDENAVSNDCNGIRIR